MTFSRPGSVKRVAEAGARLYADTLRAKLEPRCTGKLVAIEVASGDYFVGDTLQDALRQGRAKHPERVLYTVRIGARAVYSLASRATIAAATV